MKAIAHDPSSARHEGHFVDVELPAPEPGEHDVLVQVHAVSVNPVDTKVRAGRTAADAPRVLGWDAAGVVRAVGAAATRFEVGDAVYYAGTLARPGSNAELHVVDERLVAHKPPGLSFEDAAALPLTAITAWEGLVDRVGVAPDGGGQGRSLLVLGGAGGVGSITIQLARSFGFEVIATASRDESVAWCREMGASHVLDHRQPLRPQLERLGRTHIDVIANLVDTDAYWAQMADLVAPEGSILAIVETKAPVDLGLLKNKSVSFHWEMMFTRPGLSAGRERQGEILAEIARRIEAGSLRSTRTRTLTPFTAASIWQAHQLLETGRTIGKVVVAHGHDDR